MHRDTSHAIRIAIQFERIANFSFILFIIFFFFKFKFFLLKITTLRAIYKVDRD